MSASTGVAALLIAAGVVFFVWDSTKREGVVQKARPLSAAALMVAVFLYVLIKGS